MQQLPPTTPSASSADACNRRGFLVQSSHLAAVAMMPVTLGLGSGDARASVEQQPSSSPRSQSTGTAERSLRDQIGIVTASMSAQLSGRAAGRRFTLLELPKILREELDMRVIDLNSSVIPDFDNVSPAYLDRLRAAAEQAGCFLTNLKMNQPRIDMNSPDREVRSRALNEYRRSIRIASRLGCRWARPLPRPQRPDMRIHLDSYRALCDFGAEHNVQLLVENYGWMQSDATSVRNLVQRIGHDVAACPDTGNWDSESLRYAGLRETFPIAVTCDFKARELSPQGEHSAYDLERCFRVAAECGFRGPWALEHAHRDTTVLFRDLVTLRDRLRKWTQT